MLFRASIKSLDFGAALGSTLEGIHSYGLFMDYDAISRSTFRSEMDSTKSHGTFRVRHWFSCCVKFERLPRTRAAMDWRPPPPPPPPPVQLRPKAI